MRQLASNRRARRDYHVMESLEAGIVLTGTEVKAVRQGKIAFTIQGEIPARALLHEHPAASIQLRLCVLEARPDHVAIAVRPDAPGLARWIDVFLQERSVFYDAELLGRHRGPWRFEMGDPLPR